VDLGDKTTPTGAPCLRCSEPRSKDLLDDHLCLDLQEKYELNPLKVGIDAQKIEILFQQIQNLDKQFENLLGGDPLYLITDDNIVSKLHQFRKRLAKCQEILLKIYARYTPYCLNSWDALITKLETTCQTLEQRSLGK
jgi:hypothetical protein